MAHAGEALDDQCDAVNGPQLPDEPVGGCAVEQGLLDGGELLAGQPLLPVALYLPVDRFLGNTSRMAWLAIAIAVVYLMWMLPNIVIAWMEPDPGSRSVTAGREVDP